MGIIFKFLLKNISEKKFRTFLVILSIGISSALFFASGAISNTAGKMFADQARQISGTAHITVEPKQETGVSPFIDTSIAQKYGDKTEYQIPVFNGSALYAPNVEDMTYFRVLGIEIEDLNKLNPVVFYKELQVRPFEGNKVIIGKRAAEKFNLKEGSKIELEVEGTKEEFIVSAIGQSKGLFINDSKGMFMIMPKETISSLYNAKGQTNTLYLKLKDGFQSKELIEKLGTEYKDCDVKEAVNQFELQQAFSTVSIPFKVVSILVLFMSVFIVFTSFNVIAMERLPVVGTLRSIGATKKRMNFLLIMESLMLGALGGLMGLILGIGALYLITIIYVADLTEGIAVQLSFSAFQLISSFLFAVILAVGSSVVPIIRVSSIPVKEIVLGTFSKVSKRKKWVGYLAALIFAICVIVPMFLDNNLLSFIISIVCITGILTAVILVIPLLTTLASKFLKGIYPVIFRNEGALAVKNVDGNKSAINNITLLTIGISSIILIFTISSSIMSEIGKVYDKYYSYDISLTHRQADSELVTGISQIDGVKSTVGTYEMNLVELTNPSFYLNTVYGIENGEFFEYIRAEQTEEAVKAINELGSGRNAIITNLMKSKLGIKKGDKITIDFKHSKQEYTVTGFVESSFKIGNIIFIPSSYMKQDAGLQYYTNVYIKTDKDARTVTNEIKRKYLKNVLLIQTTKELVDMNQGQLDSIFNVIKSFSVLAMIIGIIGIINNLIISFIERKRYLAIYRSIGMSKKTQSKMILIESFTIGLLGVGFGIISACAMLNIIPNILRFILGSFDINYSIPIFVLVAMISVAIMVVVSSIPARKSSQMSIIESIKYE